MAFVDLLTGAVILLLAHSLGSSVVLLLKGRKIQPIDYSYIISFCAGVMSFTSVEMFNQARAAIGNAETSAALLLGVLVFFIIERSLPHLHYLVRKTNMSDSKKKATMIAGTITIHNMPEGFSVASAFAHSIPLGWLVTSTIAFQDIPEGVLVSTPLVCYGMECTRSFKFGVLSGAVEAGSAVFCYLFLSLVTSAVPPALAFSAGAMSYVVLAELLPDAFKGKAWAVAISFVAGVLAGFGIATFLRF